MLADELTKLASATVISTLHEAMNGSGVLTPPVVSSAIVDESFQLSSSGHPDGVACAPVAHSSLSASVDRVASVPADPKLQSSARYVKKKQNSSKCGE